MSDLSETVTLRVTEDMKQRVEEAGEGDYTSQGEYFRKMFLAGESAVADLDPRVGDNGNSSRDIDSAEAAAKALDDETLLNCLSEDKQEFSEIVEQLTQEFENVLANRLLELANSDHSAVETDGQGNYYLEQ